MSNPWEKVPLTDYEAHMKMDDVFQMQILCDLTQKQLFKWHVETVALLGIAGGNGLVHLEASGVSKMYGIDINREYLKCCRRRFSHLGKKLELLRLDLSDEKVQLPKTDLIIANLLIEYIGVKCFVRHIEDTNPLYVSCVIQKNSGAPFVSASPYSQVFEDVSVLHQDINSDSLIREMERIGYVMLFCEDNPLPGGKLLIRLDFEYISAGGI